MYTIITENDESVWDDKTGELYHFPNRYIRLLQPGTKVIYYKGGMQNKAFENKRLSTKQHYFGYAEIGAIYLDNESEKKDWYASIVNFNRFSTPVYLKDNNSEYFEVIPESKKENYWRDGVREINKEIYEKIICASDLSINNNENKLNDNEENIFTSIEGKTKEKYTTTYERDPRLKEQALRIHGYTCMACGFNFEKAYGEWGKGYIHIHHLKPVATSGERTVNPRTEMIALCANCHAMVHRRKNKVLTLEELKELLNYKR